jgi:hypothetical protein
MTNPILISYTGKDLVEVDLLKAKVLHDKVEVQASKKEKRKPVPFDALALKRSSTLRLCYNGTSHVSPMELKVIETTLGANLFRRFVVVHDWEPLSEADQKKRAEFAKKKRAEKKKPKGQSKAVKVTKPKKPAVSVSEPK